MDEEAQFAFLAALPRYEDEVPFHNFINGKTNIEVDRRPQVVRDVRGQQDKFTLGTTGFQFCQHILPAVDWKSKSEIEDIYVEDLKNLVQQLVPEEVRRCEMFDFRVSRVHLLLGGVQYTALHTSI